MTDPFGDLGVACRPDLTDDEVRSAWRRIAAATHPDRADGGNPAVFAAAAAAYAQLRTPTGRGEALADLLQSATEAGHADGWHAAASLAWRVRSGRPARLALRLAAAAALSAVGVLAVGWQPATLAVVVGAVTWLAVSGRSDLALPQHVQRGRLAEHEPLRRARSGGVKPQAR